MPTEIITQYKSLEEIRLRKDALLKDIRNDDKKIHQLWSSLFHRPDALSGHATPSKRLNSLMSLGAGALDGLVLGWKLYRKFKKKR